MDFNNTRRNNFIGHDGFIWWIGVVESRMDPLSIGRCRVRIKGLHSEDKSLIPTESLPWAQPLYPTNNTLSTPTTLKEGDVVMGFFMDGDAAQFPIIMGMMHGIPDTEPNPGKGFSDPRTEEELKTAPQTPNIQYKADGTGAIINNVPKKNYPETINDPSVADISRNERILDSEVMTKLKSVSVSQMIPTDLLRDIKFNDFGKISSLASGMGVSSIESLGNSMSNGLSGLADSLSQNLPNLPKSISADKAKETLSSTTSSLVDDISSKVKNTVSGLQDSISSLAGSVGTTMSDLSHIDIKAEMSSALGSIQNKISGVMGNGMDVAGAISDKLSTLSISDMLSLDDTAITNLVDVSAAKAFTDKIDKSSGFWKEPSTPYQSKFPYNQAVKTESGHIFEMDDTPGAERMHLYHRSGTFQETHPDGTKVEKIVKDNYTITLADNKVKIFGTADISISGHCNIHIEKNCNLFVDGDMNFNVKGNWTNTIGKNLIFNVKKDTKFNIGENMSITTGGTYTADITKNMSTTCHDTISYDSKNDTQLKVGGSLNSSASGSTNINSSGAILLNSPQGVTAKQGLSS